LISVVMLSPPLYSPRERGLKMTDHTRVLARDVCPARAGVEVQH